MSRPMISFMISVWCRRRWMFAEAYADIDPGGHLRQLETDVLQRSQRLPECHALPAIFDNHVEHRRRW
jgi:hypothetical protein